MLFGSHLAIPAFGCCRLFEICGILGIIWPFLTSGDLTFGLKRNDLSIFSQYISMYYRSGPCRLLFLVIVATHWAELARGILTSPARNSALLRPPEIGLRGINIMNKACREYRHCALVYRDTTLRNGTHENSLAWSSPADEFTNWYGLSDVSFEFFHQNICSHIPLLSVSQSFTTT